QQGLYLYLLKNLFLTLDLRVCRYITGIMAFCFVVGTEIESAFVVKGKLGMTVAELKDEIYAKNKNDFKSKRVDANKLHLWKVDIPSNAKNDKFIKLKTLESRHDI